MSPLRSRFALVALAFALVAPAPTAGQEPARLRAGVSLLGTSMVALVVEVMDGRQGLEFTVGTWSFRDLSLSAVAKAYFGPSALRPAVGAGIWTVLAPPRDGERTGIAVVARFPIGLDWRVASGHYVGLDVNVNRALWLQRADTVYRPMNRSLVPIPGISYRGEP